MLCLEYKPKKGSSASDVRRHPASADSITPHQEHIETCQVFVKASAGRCVLGHRAPPLSRLEPWARARGRQRGSSATWRVRKDHVARLLSTHEREDSVFAPWHASNCKGAATAQPRGRGPTISVCKTAIAGSRHTRHRRRCRVGRRRIGPLSKQTPATLHRLSRTERRRCRDGTGTGAHGLKHPKCVASNAQWHHGDSTRMRKTRTAFAFSTSFEH